MLKRCLSLFLSLCLLLSSAGCAALLKGDYLVVQEHREQEDDASGEEEIPEVGTYLTLKAAIMDLVLAGEVYGVIRLSDFTTDEIEAMSMACWEVKSTTPYGAYAVERITYEYTEILGYYDMEVHITYRRYKSQIDTLLALSTPSQVRAALRSAIRGYDGYIAISVSDSSIDENFIRDYVEEYYYNNPMYILSCPKLELYTYPDTGVKRILEAFVQYPAVPEEMSSRIIALNQESRNMLIDILWSEDALYTLDICRALTDRCTYVPSEGSQREADRSQSVYTAYGAIMEGQANGEGYAMAYKLLCDMVGIECLVVLGHLDGVEHAWNIICLDGNYYHVDPSMCDEEGYENAFLRDDDQMRSRYWWDSEKYPACSGNLSYSGLVGIESPGTAETPALEGEPTPAPSSSPDTNTENDLD